MNHRRPLCPDPVAEAGRESFPASDPPFWTLGREPSRQVAARPRLLAATCGALLIVTLLIAGSSRDMLGFSLWLLFLLLCPATHLFMYRGRRG